MIIPWLDEMVKNGSVSVKARDEICETCEGIIKQAAEGADGSTGLARLSADGGIAAEIASKALAESVMTPAFKALGRGIEAGRAVNMINKNKAEILEMPEFKKDRTKAEARFNEIIQVAPSAARNKALVVKLMQNRLHSGLTTNDTNNLAIMQHIMTPDTKSYGKLQQKLAGETLATVYKIVEDHAMTKEAAKGKKFVPPEFFDLLKSTVTLSSIPLIAGGVTGGVNYLKAKMDARKLRSAQENTYHEAVNRAPDTSPLHTDPKATRQAFNTLVHFAPHIATEPNAAGAFMKKLLEYKDIGTQPEDIKTLTDIEKNIAHSRLPSPFMSGAVSGAQAFGINRITQDATRQAEKILNPTGGATDNNANKDLGDSV